MTAPVPGPAALPLATACARCGHPLNWHMTPRNPDRACVVSDCECSTFSRPVAPGPGKATDLAADRCHLCDSGRIHLREMCEREPGVRQFQTWRREFLRGHVAGENEDHRLAGKIADQTDELDRLRSALSRSQSVVEAAEALVERWDNGDFRTGPVGTALMRALADRVRASAAVQELDRKEGERG